MSDRVRAGLVFGERLNRDVWDAWDRWDLLPDTKTRSIIGIRRGEGAAAYSMRYGLSLPSVSYPANPVLIWDKCSIQGQWVGK